MYLRALYDRMFHLHYFHVGYFPACSATTHTDLVLRARQRGIRVQVIHNASIMTAVGVCGVNLYNFGQTVSIPFFTPTWQPDSFYDKIAFNLSGGLHTLCLLGIYIKHVFIFLLIKRAIFGTHRLLANRSAHTRMCFSQLRLPHSCELWPQSKAYS